MDHLKEPPSAQVTSTKQGLGRGPEDMPKWGGRQGQVQVTSSQSKLSRTPNPVAAFGAHPKQGMEQVTSTKSSLSRKANSPYDHISKTTPQESL
jgi:hypothetical protein